MRDKREMTFLLDFEPQTQQRDRAIWSTLPKDALFQSQPPGLSFSPSAFFSYPLYLSLIAVNVTIPLKPFRGLHFLSLILLEKCLIFTVNPSQNVLAKASGKEKSEANIR